MTSQHSSMNVYRNQTPLPAQIVPVNGTSPTMPSSSGDVTRRTSHMTTIATTSSSSPLARPSPKSPESELITSFDPIKNLHLWTMWRVAVNGRIMDEVRQRNRAQPTAGGEFDYNPFGRALVKTPLDRFIRVENGSRDLATTMMDPQGQGRGHLGTEQFVFYGVPRVVLKKSKTVTRLPFPE